MRETWVWSPREGKGYPLQSPWSGRVRHDWATFTPRVLRRWRICLWYGRPRFNPWDRNISWGGEPLPTPVFLPGEFHGWTEEAGELQSMGSRRVGHDWATNTHILTHNDFLSLRFVFYIYLKCPFELMWKYTFFFSLTFFYSLLLCMRFL